ncbi:MAG: SDR family oxidoreductase, partial [Chloroflexota bacterium]
AAVVIASRSAGAVEHGLAALAAAGLPGERLAGRACDVTRQEQVQALLDFALERFGRIDVWVNNAGISPAYGPTVHQRAEEFVQTTQTNVLGSYYGSLAAMRYFLPRKQGKLINVLGRGAREPVPMQNAYASSKAWLRSFTVALAREHRDSGVGVFALNPGMMDTEMLTDVRVLEGFEDGLKNFGAVVQTLSQPPEVPARRAIWLASAATDGKTGLVTSELNPLTVLKQVARQGLNRLLGRSGRPLEIKITSVPKEWPR